MKREWNGCSTLSTTCWVAAVCMFVLTSGVIAQPDPAWTPGEAVPLGVEVGPLGATREYEATPLGTADVFGNGPYDLVLTDKKVLPFKKFLSDGTPVYGPVQDFAVPSKAATFLTDAEDVLWAVYPYSKSLRMARYNPAGRTFEPSAKGEVDLPKGARSFAATLSPRGRLLAYFSVSDGQPYNPTDVHIHSPEFQPFNGAGIWRGGTPFNGLGSAMFADGTALGRGLVKFPVFSGGRDFQFSNPGMTIVNLGPGRERDVVASDKHGTYHYYHNRAEEAINLEPGVFVSDRRGNALRHPGINPKPVAIPNPDTGYSDLIVGDTGIAWFYRFTGDFNQLGGPIYDPPKRVMVEQPKMVLSALPVITSGDVDGDGLMDLVAGNDVGDIYFLRNIGTTKSPAFDIPQPIEAGGEVLKINAGYATIQGPGEARWGYTCPTVYDWNNDGHADILFNSILADVTVLLQVPGSDQPAFEKPVVLKCDSLELHLVWRTQPAVTDWGKDGQRCIIVNDEQNYLRRFWRIDDFNVRRGDVLRLTTGEPIQTHSKRWSGQLGRTKIQAVDWDGDGVIDLLCGTGRSASIPGKGGYPDDTFKGDERQSSVLFLRNAGTNEEPVYEYPRLMHYRGEKIALGAHSCSPLAIDLGRGELDLLVGMEQGVVIYYPRNELSWPELPHGQD